VSVVPAAHFLVDFTSKNLKSELAEEPLQGAAVDIDWAERVEEAYARGLEEGRRAAEAEAAARLEEQQVAFEQNSAAMRQAWCEEQAPKIVDQVRAAIREVGDQIAGSTERILRPFLAQAIRDQAIIQLRAIVEDLVANSPGVTLEISGPEDLIDAVRTSLSASVATVSYVANEASDVQIKAGASIIETRIAAWLKASEGQVA